MLNRVSLQLRNITRGNNNNFKKKTHSRQNLKPLVEPITPSPPPQQTLIN